MSSFQDSLAVVIDLGSKFTKAGFAPESFPRTVFPTAVGRFQHPGLLDGYPELFFGNEAIRKQGVSKLKWPVQGGLIRDWDEMEKLWHHTFYRELLEPPEKTRVLHTVHPLVPRGDREKMAEILFESFAINYLNLVKTPALVLHASGRTSGLVYENGAQSAYAAPIYEGFPLQHAIEPSPLDGERLTDVITHSLSLIGYTFTTPFERQIVNDIKTKICYVAGHYDSEMDLNGRNQTKYHLPDGQEILIGNERFKCAEALFQPSLLGIDAPSVVDVVCRSVARSETEYQKMFFENIVISGGTTMLTGFPERLLAELSRRPKIQSNTKVQIDQIKNRQNLAWVGGSILASLESGKGFWVSKQEYDDVGAEIVNYRFF